MWASVNSVSSTVRVPGWSIETAEIDSRSSPLSRRSGIGVSHRSTSSPIWCEAWPVRIGPPRGCAMSPTSRPGQPSARAPIASRSMKATSAGMAPDAVARQPHRLPGRAVDRQCSAAGEAALGVAADDRGIVAPVPARSPRRTAPWPAARPRPLRHGRREQRQDDATGCAAGHRSSSGQRRRETARPYSRATNSRRGRTTRRPPDRVRPGAQPMRGSSSEAKRAGGPVVDRPRLHLRPARAAEHADRARHVHGRGDQQPALARLRVVPAAGHSRAFSRVERARALQHHAAVGQALRGEEHADHVGLAQILGALFQAAPPVNTILASG